jgi:polysaccharide deacetylase family protein (PEP-CTERM system associated)
MLNALTIDVEEHFQVHAFERVIQRSDWDRHPSRVVANTRRILALLEEFGVRATFFVLGWVADRQPELVTEIVAGGHEVASHGHWHELVYRQTAAEFAEDLEQALGALGRAVHGLRVTGYRAPSFSITKESLWALDVLRDHGFEYDTSIFPIAFHDRYGMRGAPRFVHRAGNGLWEIPPSTLRIGAQNWPVAGGGWFRAFPLWITREAVRRINREGHPAVVYLHPWEFDPDQPRMQNAPWRSRFRHSVNLGRTESRLRVLLREFDFGPVRRAFDRQLAAGEEAAVSAARPS